MSNNPSLPSLGSAISALSSRWRYGYLLESLVAREVKVRYRRSVLGVLWTLLNPILMMAIFTVVFSTLFARTLDDFPIYFLSANLSWHFFAGGSNLAMTSMVRNAALYKRIYVPKYIFVLAAVLSDTVNFVISLIPLAALMLIFRHPVTPAILFVPVAFVILLIFTTGVSFIVATIAVFFDDITQFYQVILQALMYLTALFYPLSIVPPAWRILIEMNPLYHLIQLIREPIYDGKMPAPESIVFATVTAIAVLVIGWFLFSRNSDRFVYYV
jgi:ABC-type polysaccharide/polyol phosphate export permease